MTRSVTTGSRWRKCVWAACGVLSLLAISAEAQQPESGSSTSLQERIRAIVGRYENANKGIVGVSVRDGATGRELATVRGDELFVPASNQKLLTGAFALTKLGGGFQFDTRVYARGSELVIVGDFDPTLGDPKIAEATSRGGYADLDEWAAAAAKHFSGRQIDTIVIVQGSGGQVGRHPDWPENQRTAGYAAPAGAASFANNCIGVTFRIVGGQVEPELFPSSRFMNVFNKITVGSRHQWALLATRDLSDIVLRGTIKTSTTEPLQTAIDDPAMLLARALGDRLIRAGADFGGQWRTEGADAFDSAQAALLARTHRPLQAAMWQMGKHSLNMAAECVLLRAGDGTWDGSAAMMTDTLMKTYGLKTSSLTVRDGSGLSAGNRLSPSAMTSVLTGVLQRDDWAILVNSLPLAGVEGRMADRLTDPPYRGRVLAKTGYIFGAQCLSGYILTEDNAVAMAYSVLVNQVPGGQGRKAKAVHEEVCRLLVDVVDGRIEP